MIFQSLRNYWRAYFIEAVASFGFVFLAGTFTILLEHPNSPAADLFPGDYPILRRVPNGLIMGSYIGLVNYLWGKSSGAHANPSTTWAYFRLGKITFTNAVFYTLAQFAGAIVGTQFLKLTFGSYFAHPLINFGVTEPKPPHGSATAFIAEFSISFVLMAVTLVVISRKNWEKSIPIIVAVLIAFFIIFETPLSGMSLNPARSFAGDLAANRWEHLWIYFVAPPTAMLVAAEIYLRVKPVFKDFFDKEPSSYPVEKAFG
ncbi:MAG: aquaporin [Pyrinomonadaceae bacterium]|nr:aquaporin [Pyrinomonadaceae bacterium]